MGSARWWFLVAAVALPGGCILAREGTLDGEDGGAAGTGGGPSVTSTTSAVGGATSTTTSSAGGTGGGPVESDCTNGLDDDGDGDVDCDDSDCGDAGYTCLATLPNAVSQLLVRQPTCP